MTRSDMLAYLLKHVSQSPQLLDEVYGDEWIQPVIDLIDLGLVTTYQNRDQVTVFQVVGWKGRGLTPGAVSRASI